MDASALAAPAVAAPDMPMETQEGGKKRRVGALQNGPCFVKLLVGNQYAGQLIGKAGQVVAEIEGQTGATLRLSATNAFFPGTTDRIAVASGELEQISAVFRIIMEKLRTAQEEGMSDAASFGCQIVVPKSSVSRIIGKGGAQIKELQQQTQAHMRISNREEGLSERVVSISGDKEKVVEAGLKVIGLIQEDENLSTCTNLKYSLMAPTPSAFGGPMGGQPVPPSAAMGPYGVYGMAPTTLAGSVMALHGLSGVTDDLLSSFCEISFQLADHFVGVLIGRGGQGIAEVSQTTGAKVQVSSKGEYVPGTQNRTVNITGPVLGVHKAHLILLQKIYELETQNKQAGLGGVQQGGALGGMGNPSQAAPASATQQQAFMNGGNRTHAHAAGHMQAPPHQAHPNSFAATQQQPAAAAYGYGAPMQGAQAAGPVAQYGQAAVPNAAAVGGARGAYDWHPLNGTHNPLQQYGQGRQ
uniref:K Homology domain-containing protein n=1 Tax=Chromera velia CCMP2878 TaxID=1169474 RepID=A0A0G4GLY5_9ALVE|mmetsp:Transcript_26138/g.51325  ORF Transcript_26138/g.51325 Transcript_26138/m.51325 type:complete len:469 (-) Transcript_26138:627-2033(-)|eukprot:Cvel_22481.t1-p1 / transcript=Cvel_22481.t1 / gene=Cvel_22481 / organism=Chromera_velia_CCMP2878 / gene_product=RNA-binding protein Nova-2, putative / transcript_product=RNA-binding protein Nova-2, putative / location=Cvel_scaffold2213:22576-27835(-) / protein_length=468 / sequence_SO=supercontig / SO=protein_coding / is_pseudo=false